MRRFQRWQRQFLLLVLLLGGGEFAQAKVLYVNSSSPTNPPPDGLTWATAFVNVSDGLSAAVDGDQVWVAAGIYDPVGLKAGVALYGGFAGTETNLETRNWLGHPTVLDGHANTTVVKVPTGATNTTRIDGFVIRNGSSSTGGGISCKAASPVIANNVIAENLAVASGAGIYCLQSYAVITNNTIAGNRLKTATPPYQMTGGGIYAEGGGVTIVSNWVHGNVAGSGAGIACAGGTPVVARNLIVGNQAFVAGGGIECSRDAAQVRQNRIIANVVEGGKLVPALGGAGILCTASSTAAIVGNRAVSNGFGAMGGGIALLDSSAVVANNLIADNSVKATNNAPLPGAGIYCGFGAPVIINNTFLRNQTGPGLTNDTAGTIVAPTSRILLANNLIAFSSSGVKATGVSSNSTPVLLHNCFYGNAAFDYRGSSDPMGSNGNFSADPRLEDGNGGFYLQPDSPCIDAGTNLIGLISTDLIGHSRPLDGNGDGIPAFDIGAAEFALPSLPAFIQPVLVDGGSLTLKWTSAALGMTLQRATRLTNPDWEDLPNSEGTNTVTLPVTGSAAFFRLVKP